MGFHTFKCPNCDYIRKVAHTCKSRFCNSCKYLLKVSKTGGNTKSPKYLYPISQRMKNIVRESRVYSSFLII